jgi:hypothetical protein
MKTPPLHRPTAAHRTAELESVFRDRHSLVFRAACHLPGKTTGAGDELPTVFLRPLKRDPAAAPVASITSFLHGAAANGLLDLTPGVAAPQRPGGKRGAMRGDIACATGLAIPFFQSKGTRPREMSYR